MSSLAERLAANRRFDFVCDAFAADKFDVVKMEGQEAISRLFRFTLILVSDDPAIDFDTMLQTACTFRVYAPDGASAVPYHGVLAEFEQLQQAGGYCFYRAVLVPRLWRLSLYRNSAVYLNGKTVPDIIEEVLKNGQLVGASFEKKLIVEYPQRSFVCQYQETHLDFISRLMEKEGIAYFFDHSGGVDKLIVVDDKIQHPTEAVTVRYQPPEGDDSLHAGDAVHSLLCRQTPLPRKVVLRDYNYHKANLELKVEAVVFDKGVGEVMLYGENFGDESEGLRYAKLRAQEILCRGKMFHGEGTATGLRAGYFMTMRGHFRENFNGDYLVTEVSHEGSQAGALLAGIRHPFGASDAETIYRCGFTAIPADVQFRPARITPKPKVAGTMSATIDTEGQEPYAELDKFGHYKVRFPFDGAERGHGKGSAPIRLASPYAGSDHGVNFPLHRGADVLLAFTDGDPDRPVIVGAVHNSETQGVYDKDNSRWNRIRTKGGNELIMDDTQGKEAIWLKSPYNDSHLGVGHTDSDSSFVQLITSGYKSFIKGTASALVLGSSNEITVGGSGSFNFGWGTQLSMGLSTTIDLGWSPTTLNMSAKPSITVDDHTDYGLCDQGVQVALDRYEISAGKRTGSLHNAKLKAIKSQLKKSILANAALKLAQATVLAKSAEGKLGKPGDFWLNWGGVLGATQTAAFQAIDYWIKKDLPKLMEESPEQMATNIRMDKDGIKLTADTTGTSARHAELGSNGILLDVNRGPNGTRGYSRARMTAKEVNIGSYWSKAAADDANLSYGEITLGFDPGTATVRAYSKIALKIPNFGGPDCWSDIELTKDMIWLGRNRDNVLDTGLRVSENEVKLNVGQRFGSVLSLQESKAELSCNQAAVSVDNKNISLQVPGTEVKVSSVGLTVNGQLVKLG